MQNVILKSEIAPHCNQVGYSARCKEELRFHRQCAPLYRARTSFDNGLEYKDFKQLHGHFENAHHYWEQFEQLQSIKSGEKFTLLLR